MKKLFIFLLASLMMLSVSAQEKPAKDTAQAPMKQYVLSGTDQAFNYLLGVISQSKLILNGEQLSFVQIGELIKWVQSAKEVPAVLPKKEEPPKKPTK